MYISVVRYNISVDVPLKENRSYTLYAQGYKTGVPSIDDKNHLARFKFLGGTAVALFYNFGEFRRAYIVTGYDERFDLEIDKSFLPGIEQPLLIIAKYRAKKVDELKNVLHFLTLDDETFAFEMPLAFWHRLTSLIERGGVKKAELEYLLSMKYEWRPL